ncbi:DUF4203 domain-containing protein [Brachybacterium saurashtrense]|nr:DUF4203 domain-containing protein [Brachybacterium saurashtrense]
MLIAAGTAMCFAGARSVRLAVLVAGFGAGWTLALVLDTTPLASLLIALLVAIGALLVMLLVSRSAFFVAGFVVGGVTAIKAVALISGASDTSWILAVALVPPIALGCAWLTARWRTPMLRWGTAVAGAALILTGVEHGVNSLESLFLRPWPASALGTLLVLASWAVIAVCGERVQARARHHVARVDE